MTGDEAGYDPDFYASLSSIEDRHFWFRARNDVISLLVGQIAADLPPGYRVLEVGTGTGNVLRVLERGCLQGRVIGMDLLSQGLRYARQRCACPLLQGDVRALPFGVQFDLIGLFDVLEHLPGDERTLRALAAALKEGGALVLTTPAHPALWSYFDEASHHCRRYVRAELEGKLLRAGLTLEYVTEYMASPLPLVWLGRRLMSALDRRPTDNPQRIRGLAGSELRVVPVVNDVLAFLLRLETRLVDARRRLPVGTSLVAVARRGSGNATRE